MAEAGQTEKGVYETRSPFGGQTATDVVPTARERTPGIDPRMKRAVVSLWHPLRASPHATEGQPSNSHRPSPHRVLWKLS